MATTKTLSWNDKIAIIEQFKPTDTEIKQQMGVSQAELDTARELRNSGVVIPTKDLDFNAYASMFSIPAAAKPAKKSTATSITAVTKPSQTANKSIKTPRKRGRKGNSISIAFGAIPTTPVPADQFATEHGVSLAVLRQSKRFDGAPELGAVRVKKNKTTKSLEIWRDAPEV